MKRYNLVNDKMVEDIEGEFVSYSEAQGIIDFQDEQRKEMIENMNKAVIGQMSATARGNGGFSQG